MMPLYDSARLEIIEHFPMPQLRRQRTIRIYLPQGYHQDEQRYPTLYMHDGQNVFDDATAAYGTSWRAAKVLDRIKSEANQGFILIAIDCGSEDSGLCRFHEYSPWKMDAKVTLPNRPQLNRCGGQGQAYLDFLTDTLKPYIDAHYRTRPQRDSTYIAGSSMGALISLYAGVYKSDVFSGCGVFSPAFWFNQPMMNHFVQASQLTHPLKVYMDMGTEETSDPAVANFADIYLAGSREMATILQAKHNLTLCYKEFVGDTHSETAWMKRLPIFLHWLIEQS